MKKEPKATTAKIAAWIRSVMKLFISAHNVGKGPGIVFEPVALASPASA
jgi:hypothetical protein